MKYLTIIFLFCLLSFAKAQQNDYPFEKKVWVFWHDENFSNAPLIAQLCSERLKKSADKAGFLYTILNEKNLKDYVTDYDEKITKVREKSPQKSIQSLSDLIRLTVLHEHGGIWMDITEILFDDFNWLINIKSDKYKNLITNRFSDQPDVLLFYLQRYQNAAQHRISSPLNKNDQILFNEIPGYEMWFFAAKKNSTLIGKIRETFIRFIQMPFLKVQKLFELENIYMNTQDLNPYLTINFAISYVMQRKQLQLDREFSLFSYRRLTAEEHYRVWGLSALLGPLVWVNAQNIWTHNLIDHTIEEFQANGLIMKFFMKLIGRMTNAMTWRFGKLQQLYQDKEFTIQKFIQSSPSLQQCQSQKFLVVGSVLYPVLQNSSYLQSGKIKAITREENQKWRNYCSRYLEDQKFQLQPLMEYLFFLTWEAPVTIPFSKAHEIVNFGKQNQTFSEKIHDISEQNYFSLWFFLRLLLDFSVVSLVLLIIFNFIRKVFIKKSIIQQQSYQEISLFSHRAGEQLRNKENNNHLDSILEKVTMYVAFVLMLSLSLFRYFYVDHYGYRDIPFSILLVVIVVVWIQNYIETRINRFRSLEILYDASYLYINFCMTYICFSFTRKNKIWLIYCTVITSLVGPCLLRLIERMQSNNSILKCVKYFSDRNYYRLLLVLFILIINIVPSLRYITTNQHYTIQIIPYIPTISIGIIYCVVLFESIRSRVIMQILRILLLGGLSIWLYYRVSLRNQIYAPSIRKVMWNLILVATFQAIYVQLGQEFINVKLKGSSKSCHRLVSCVLKVLDFIVCFTGLYIQLLWGSFCQLLRIQNGNIQLYREHIHLVANFLFICVYMHVRTAIQLGKIQQMNAQKQSYSPANQEMNQLQLSQNVDSNIEMIESTRK